MSNLLTMDLKDIKLFGGKKGGKVKKLPAKRVLNLAVKEKTINTPSRAIPLFALLLALIALFSKFGVSDRLGAAMKAETAAQAAEEQLAQMKVLTADYEQVRAEYERRVFDDLDTLTAGADAMDLLALLEEKLMAHARVENFSAQDPIVSVSLSGVTLAETAKLVNALEESPMVASVMVYTANTSGVVMPTMPPTPTPKPTRTPKPKRTPKGQTPSPTPVPTPTPTLAPEDVPVAVTMTITLNSTYSMGGES